MYEPSNYPIIDIDEWVEAVRYDPPRHRERQATQILLAATHLLIPHAGMALKGGILMSVRYGSPRQTGDVDFSFLVEPDSFPEPERFRLSLDQALNEAALNLGYVDLWFQTRNPKERPRSIRENTFPALEFKIGYAKRGSPQQARLEKGQSGPLLSVDASFREPIFSLETVIFPNSNMSFHAYSLVDLIAEKYRALLQQSQRRRSCREDVYDIAFLVERIAFNEEFKRTILSTIRKKCESRFIYPDI